MAAQLETDMKPEITREEVTNLVRNAVIKYGGAIKLAAKLDVTPSYISHVLNGKKPGPKVCKLVGVEEIRDTWRRTK